VKVTRPHLVLRLRMMPLYLRFPIRLRGAVFNQMSVWIICSYVFTWTVQGRCKGTVPERGSSNTRLTVSMRQVERAQTFQNFCLYCFLVRGMSALRSE
jgi:hypothetical protein